MCSRQLDGPRDHVSSHSVRCDSRALRAEEVPAIAFRGQHHIGRALRANGYFVTLEGNAAIELFKAAACEAEVVGQRPHVVVLRLAGSARAAD